MKSLIAAQLDVTPLKELLLLQDQVNDIIPVSNPVEVEKITRSYCMIYSDNKVYKGTPGQTPQDIINQQNITTGNDIAYINVFNDIAIIEYLSSRSNISRIITAIKQVGTFKKIYFYQDQRGTKLSREASYN